MKRDAAESLTHNTAIAKAMDYWSKKKHGDNHFVYYNAGLVIGDDVELDIGIFENIESRKSGSFMTENKLEFH
jgi:hypothetical protein